MATRKTAADPDYDTLHAAVQELGAQIAELAGTGQEGLKSKLQAGAERLRGLIESARERGENAARELRQEVKAHPLASVAVAFAVGLILGGLLRRR
ncbi:MAG: DUF883 family protein [Planctomycetota bacterium]|nr:MAG: DUF883 family protein [Planctomycetota bacterium]